MVSTVTVLRRSSLTGSPQLKICFIPRPRIDGRDGKSGNVLNSVDRSCAKTSGFVCIGGPMHRCLDSQAAIQQAPWPGACEWSMGVEVTSTPTFTFDSYTAIHATDGFQRGESTPRKDVRPNKSIVPALASVRSTPH